MFVQESCSGGPDPLNGGESLKCRVADCGVRVRQKGLQQLPARGGGEFSNQAGGGGPKGGEPVRDQLLNGLGVALRIDSVKAINRSCRNFRAPVKNSGKQYRFDFGIGLCTGVLRQRLHYGGALAFPGIGEQLLDPAGIPHLADNK